MTDDEQCVAIVYKQESLRYTGRKGRFNRHYIQCRCSRKVRAEGYAFCWQHALKEDQGVRLRRWWSG